MGRLRCFMFLVLAAVLAHSAPGAAQSPPYRIAVLTPGLTFSPVFDSFREALARLGYHDGKQLQFIVEDAGGDTTSLPQRVERLVASNPHLIFTVATAQAAAAKRATGTIPIVFTWVSDPVGSGFVASYSSSGNNVTGVSNESAALSGKRLEVLAEASPKIKRVLAVVPVKEEIAQRCIQALEAAAKRRGVHVLRKDVTSKEDIQRVLRETPRGAFDAIALIPSSLGVAHIALLIQRAKEDRVPLSVHEDSMVEQGALLSYGPDFQATGVQAAKLAAKILQGAKPSELAIQTPEKIFLAINVTTAKTIGLKLPRSLTERADQLID
jgi:putative tryptophan/tyrosine transport system substrate-binding protein